MTGEQEQLQRRRELTCLAHAEEALFQVREIQRFAQPGDPAFDEYVAGSIMKAVEALRQRLML